MAEEQRIELAKFIARTIRAKQKEGLSIKQLATWSYQERDKPGSKILALTYNEKGVIETGVYSLIGRPRRNQGTVFQMFTANEAGMPVAQFELTVYAAGIRLLYRERAGDYIKETELQF